MPARTQRIRHDTNTRSKIQAAHLIRRLHQAAMGEISMDSNQISAAKALLNKVLPDLQSVQASVEQHTTISGEAMKPEDWAQQYAQGDEGTERAH